MEGNENTKDTVEVHIDLNGEGYVDNMESNEHTIENSEPKEQVEEDVQEQSLHSNIHLHSIPNMHVHILHDASHVNNTEELNSSDLENQSTVCVVSDAACTSAVLLSETISMSSANINVIPQTVVLTTPVLSNLCSSQTGTIDEDIGDEEQHESLLISKNETEELLIPKSEPTQELDDSCIGLTASVTGITNSVNDKLNTTTAAEGIVVTAHQTSMCYLRQIFDHDQVTSQGQMPTLAHGVTSHDLPELQQCKWQGCCQHFLSLEDLVRHVNEYHIRTDKHAEFCCHWHGCSRNGKGFNARYKMLIHMRTHTGEKPHKCHHEDCGKSFSRLENLKIHQRSHTGERPYICPIEGCDKRYSNSSDRFKHTRTHYERKPYHCRIEGCEKCYTDPSSLRKHLKTHHGQDVNIEDHD